ncbi:Leucine-rich repeat [Carpediemonas membranifera]|uniref:Leucine-rich repeat n=1 Tax=Carpediemonas membranifera TaxID=201153 RepID=A0A8J6E1K6_9EUKA|nr:Leucine-rich repeat [Carpediemonas membranifera]|eukprot:KAG9390757.1 Leucine-rich repeat [Carpediemonas membranifera]
MPPITRDLLLKRTEHRFATEDPQLLREVEEIALHQQHIKKIELLKEYMPHLTQLLLQNNDIRKIENLTGLPRIKYLNLALNKISRLSGLSRVEDLEKLDLMCNYLYQLHEISHLRSLPNLKHLTLMGNPVTDFPDYREYVVLVLGSQLDTLDGTNIVTSEKVAAELRKDEIMAAAEAWDAKAKPPAIPEDDEERQEHGAVPNNRKAREDKINSLLEPYKTESGGLAPDGRRLQKNEAGWHWEFAEDSKLQTVTLTVDISPEIQSTAVDIDSEPDHVKLTTKSGNKSYLLLLNLPHEVQPSQCHAIRVQCTGQLILTWPVANGTVIPRPAKAVTITDRAEEVGQNSDSEDDFSDLPDLE